jgi:hypothetical protein
VRHDQRTGTSHASASSSRLWNAEPQLTARLLRVIALKTMDGHAVLVGLAEEMRRRSIIIPGISVAERMAAEAMHAADKTAVGLICAGVPAEPRTRVWMHFLTEKSTGSRAN